VNFVMSSTTNGKALYENLDTTFVNLWSLLRNLTQRGFVGRVHVELANYSADVFLNGSGSPLVREVDRAAGTDTLEEAALHRLVLRARETPGTISVFEGPDEAKGAPGSSALPVDESESFISDPTPSTSLEVAPPLAEEPAREPVSAAPPIEIFPQDEPAVRAEETQPESNPYLSALPVDAPEFLVSGPSSSTSFEVEAPPVEEPAQEAVSPAPPLEIFPKDELAMLVAETHRESKPGAQGQMAVVISVSGELIGAVERGINAAGEDFISLFRSVRLELADDYSYLDPMSNAFTYVNGVVSLSHEVPEGMYVSSLSETLRRTVDKAAVGDRARRLRERIALELLGVARKHKATLERSKFGLQLDRIAGTKVI